MKVKFSIKHIFMTLVSVGVASNIGAAYLFGFLFASSVSADNLTNNNLSSNKQNSQLTFEFTQAGASNYGEFPEFNTELVLTDDGQRPKSLSVEIDVAAINTDDEERDEMLRSSDFFDVKTHDKAQFFASKFSQSAQGYVAEGKLTIRGVTQTIQLPFALNASNEGNGIAGKLKGDVVIKRLDYGIGQGDWTSTMWVGDDVTVSFDLTLQTQGNS